MPCLLLIDDDLALGPPLATYFGRHGFALEHATHPDAGLARLARGGVDAVILDVMLPGRDGFAVCRALRALGSSVPILMLTARGDVMDRVVGLELGADDYLPKPFEPRELLARVQTILRRTTAAPVAAALAPALQLDGLQVDTARRQVHRQGQPLELTSAEFDLLALLAAAPGRVFTRDDILERLRGHAALDIQSRAVDILVSRLRRKLAPWDGIKTLRNAGYTLAAVPATGA